MMSILSRSCRSSLVCERHAKLLIINKMPFMPSMPPMFLACACAFLYFIFISQAFILFNFSRARPKGGRHERHERHL